MPERGHTNNLLGITPEIVVAVLYAGPQHPDNGCCHRTITCGKVLFAYLYFSPNKHINITMSFPSTYFDVKD